MEFMSTVISALQCQFKLKIGDTFFGLGDCFSRTYLSILKLPGRPSHLGEHSCPRQDWICYQAISAGRLTPVQPLPSPNGVDQGHLPTGCSSKLAGRPMMKLAVVWS